MRLRGLRCFAVAAPCAAGPFPVSAAVVDQGAVAQTMILVFVVFAMLLFVIVLALVALVSRQPFRLAHLRIALISFPAASAAAALLLVLLQGDHRFAAFEVAAMSCGIVLIVAALALVAYAFFASRREGG